MLLPSEDAAQFLRLYPALLGFVAGRLGGIEGIHDLASFHTCALEAKAKVESGIITILEEADAAESAAPVLRGRDRRSKVRVHVLLDSDVLAYFEQEAERSGRRRDTLINATLRQAIEATVSDTDPSRPQRVKQ